jgi:hypothetical protein
MLIQELRDQGYARFFSWYKVLWSTQTPATTEYVERFIHEFVDPKLTFTDYDSYMIWRAKWKLQYKQLTIEIRDAKRRRKGKYPVMKEYSIAGKISFLPALKDKETEALYRIKMEAVETAYRGKLCAGAMLLLLKEAKKKSWQIKTTVAL